MREPKASPPRIVAIVCAAGSGVRFGAAQGSKLDQDLHGKPVLIRAVEAIAAHPDVVSIVVAGPADPAALAQFRERHEADLSKLGATICPGGISQRYETVKAGLEHLSQNSDSIDAVLVHDAARPCVPSAVVRRVIDALADHAAVVPATPIADTLKRSAPAAGSGLARVLDTVDRSNLFGCQTPQGFHLGLITRAYAQADLSSTDDAQLVERLGEAVVLVEGDPRNLKITRPQDLELARAVWPTLAGKAQ